MSKYHSMAAAPPKDNMHGGYLTGTYAQYSTLPKFTEKRGQQSPALTASHGQERWNLQQRQADELAAIRAASNKQPAGMAYQERNPETGSVAASAANRSTVSKASKASTKAQLSKRIDELAATLAALQASNAGLTQQRDRFSRSDASLVRERRSKEDAYRSLVGTHVGADTISNKPLTGYDLSRTLPQDNFNARGVAGAYNTKLVGSKWRVMEAPEVTEATYTDYFGPVGGGRDNFTYYGRKYNQGSGPGKLGLISVVY